jgi:hypothetical protein
MSVKMDVMATRIKSNQTNQQVPSPSITPQLMQKIQGINPILIDQTQNINLEVVAATMDQFQKSMDELQIGGQMVTNQLQNQMQDGKQDAAVDQMMQQMKGELNAELDQDFDLDGLGMNNINSNQFNQPMTNQG